MTSSERAFFTSLLVTLSLSGEAAAQRTAQDIETARQLFNQGMNLKEKGDLPGALDKLRAAHALGNTPVTGLELCRTHASLGQPVEAREVCLGVARIPPLPQETARSQEARTEAARLAESEKPKISALRLKVTGVPAGLQPVVIVDGASVPPAALGEPRSVNPGTHTVSARVGGGVETKASLETSPGETRDIELIVEAPSPGQSAPPVLAPPPASPAAVPEKTAESKGNPVATAGFVVGGAGLVVGTVAGLVAMSAESDLSKKCVDKNCGRDLHGDLERAERWANVSTAFFIVAGVGLASGLIATLVSSSSPTKSASARPTPKTQLRPTIGFGGAGLHGSF